MASVSKSERQVCITQIINGSYSAQKQISNRIELEIKHDYNSKGYDSKN